MLQKFWPHIRQRVFENVVSTSELSLEENNAGDNSSTTRIDKQTDGNITKTEEIAHHKMVYKQATEYISDDTDLVNMVTQNLGDKTDRVAIVGLHTCGNLSPSCLRLMTANMRYVRCLINVGCCYHLMNEEFTGSDFWFDIDPLLKGFGFPMSNYLRSLEFSLGRNARMIAAQSTDRVGVQGQVCR